MENIIICAPQEHSSGSTSWKQGSLWACQGSKGKDHGIVGHPFSGCGLACWHGNLSGSNGPVLFWIGGPFQGHFLLLEKTRMPYLRISRSFFFMLMCAICCSQAAAQVRAGKAVQAGERIRIDGKLDEPAWQQAVPLGPLTQVEPKEGEAPTEETEVRVLYDAEAIYFGIQCFDRTPDGIVSTQLIRDGELDVDDYVGIVLDPFFDRRNGFLFAVNPAGARADGQISNNSEEINLDWDGIWNAVARKNNQGWAAEFSIPYKTLRFKPGQTIWGVNIERQIKRKNEKDRWSGARRDVWITNLAEAGELRELPVIHQGLGLDIRPYGLVRRDPFDPARQDKSAWVLDGGLDISKNLTPNLNASLTMNTDFAETEADTRQVNLTRFSLFYPEKRPFFLEGAGVFETAGSSTWHPDLLPFFSRRIGLYEDQEVPILFGSKLTGRQSHFNIGLLDVQTGHADIRNEDGKSFRLDGQNLLAARVSRDIFEQSYIGAIFTRGNPAGTGDNSLIGADARFATSRFRGDKNLKLDLFLMRTSDQRTHTSDYAGGFWLDYPNDRWDMRLQGKQIGDNFRPALGFVPRRGMRKASGGIEFSPRPEKWGIRKLEFGLEGDIITDLNNAVENWSFSFTPIGIEMNSGDHVQVNVSREFERLPETFEIFNGIALPPGSYRWNRYEIETETASKRFWVLQSNLGWGTFYNGTRRQIGLGLTLKPSTHFNFGIESERNDVSLKQGEFYTQLFSVRGDFNFSPNLSWANLVQYDNESRLLGFQTRFRWILKPGNDLFVVLNRGWYRTLNRRYLSTFDRATVKLAYTFRF
jgi:hypothetical protein